jgi:UDP-N-acetylmuramate--alanine ligase
MNHVHFIGIGGVGMSGLAHVLLSRGVRVSGSDPSVNEATERLVKQGATIYREQAARNIPQELPDLVVMTAAIPEDNPELLAARSAGIPVETRAEFLGTLMAGYKGPRIAVSGTHGKTTTTAMVAEILQAAGSDPTVLIGGEYPPIGGNVRMGRGDTFLTEACEAYDSFLSLRPDIALITNVEADHLDHYGSEDGVFTAFRQFVDGIHPDGALILCANDPGCIRLESELKDRGDRPSILRYGVDSPGATINAVSVEATTEGSLVTVELMSPIRATSRFELKVPGRHNVLNALGAAAVGLAARIPFDRIAEGLARFSGTGRRFERLGEREGVLVVDDYAHHPTEIKATLDAARQAYPDRRLVAVFQPHLYSRTRDFMAEFAESLSRADAVLLTDIYAAREKPIEGVRVADMTRLIADRAPNISLLYLPRKDDLVGALNWVARPGDVILTMGAGDIRTVGESYLAS